MLALDTETTGLDLFHGAKPYLVTVCDEAGDQRFWEWDVCPTTREPTVSPEDIEEIKAAVAGAAELVGQNAKFDAKALETVGVGGWPWAKTFDTLTVGHLLHSGQPHDLTSMALMAGIDDIRPLEVRLEAAVVECRRMVQQAKLRVERAIEKGQPPLFDEPLAAWRIAKEGLADMPSAKGGGGKEARGVESSSPWKFDAWLPRALASFAGYPEPDRECQHAWGDDWLCASCGGHRFWVVCSEYANGDSASTVQLAVWQKAELLRRGLWRIWGLGRKPLLPITPEMERRGATFSLDRADELETEFGERSRANRATCVGIAAKLGFELEMPKGASPNGSLRAFCFDVLKLPPMHGAKSKTAAPTLDKNAMAVYKLTLDKASDQGRFVNALLDGRGWDTSLAYMRGYRRYGVPVPGTRFLRLHPNFNPVGTDHLRWSCSNPNGQNIPKLDLDEDDPNVKTVRWLFGPAPGREWWSLDYANIELRIPAYESGEESMIALFERPDDPPYFGSYHYLNASIIYPDLFWPLADIHPEDKRSFKNRYKPTWYQWCKNFGFALQYQCGEATGNRAAHKAGAWRAVKVGLPKMEALNSRWVDFANKRGYVETLPSRRVDPSRGYPIECTRSEWGRISPTVPLNYHVSSTAMQAINEAMIQVHPVLAEWRAGWFDAFVALQVHDELVIDMPAGGARNLPKVRTIKALMEESGTDIGIPLKVSVSWHPDNWGEAVELSKVKGAA